MPRGSLSCPSLGYNSGLRDEYVDDIFARKQTFWGATSKIAGEVLNRIKVARRQATASPIVSARQRNHMPERYVNTCILWSFLLTKVLDVVYVDKEKITSLFSLSATYPFYPFILHAHIVDMTAKTWQYYHILLGRQRSSFKQWQ